jgi:ribosome-associated translation inhibitor RaiA
LGSRTDRRRGRTMKLQVTGKNLDVTDPIVDYAERKLTRLT